MLLLQPILIFFPSSFNLMFAMQNSALYRYPTGDLSLGNFKRHPFFYLWAKKVTSSMVKDQLHCTFLCVRERKCYSFNMAAYPDFKGLYLCELLATDKYRETKMFVANDTFHHYKAWSPCERAPCANGGICVPEYEWNSFHCDCPPGFCGILCQRRGSKTCSNIKDCNPKAKNGSYVIDPDEEGGVEPFTVYCDMTDKDGVGVTVISHNSESRTLVDGFEDAGSYSRNVAYNATSLLQLASLTVSSAHCEQFIKYECINSLLLYEMHGWWVSRDGENMTYWGGVDSVAYKCACGLNNTCLIPERGCNCDSNDDAWQEDSGFLTDKSKLPVSQLRFGDTGGFDESGYYTLGKLKCFGLIKS